MPSGLYPKIPEENPVRGSRGHAPLFSPGSQLSVSRWALKCSK